MNEDEEGSGSASAYKPEGTDLLLDFSFEHLKRANDILKFAATKLELEGHPSPADSSEEQLGAQLRAARLRAGHSQRAAAKVIGYDHKYISEWETGKRKPHPQTLKNILDYIGKHSKPKQP